MIKCKKATPQDAYGIVGYFNAMSPTTKRYYAPHDFDVDTVISICQGNYKKYQAFIGIEDDLVIAYAVIKNGLKDGEVNRFAAYAVRLSSGQDYSLAPSVADAFQSQGIGGLLLNSVESHLKELGAEKIILWGGVQLRNQKAVQYYLKNGFQTLGKFWHDGIENLDMVKYLNNAPTNQKTN
ncbi:MAG: GNAT family N-acetyltransferase [Bacteroidota bacterium]